MPFKASRAPRGRSARRIPAVSVGIRMIGPVSSRKPAAFISIGPEIISKMKLQDQTPVEVLVGYGKDIGKVQLVFGPNQNFTVLARKEAPHSPTMVIGTILIPVGDNESSVNMQPVDYEILDPRTIQISLPWKLRAEHLADL
ncbi:hypothetical protein EB061_07485 [bacterium]|nr:hypothetical protein [bacterium]